MKQINIILTDSDRYYLSVLFSLAGCLASGHHPGPSVQLAIAAADNLKKLLKETGKDEQ